MAYYESETRGRLSFAQVNNTLLTLIAVNMVIFVILLFIQAVFHLRVGSQAEAMQTFQENVLSWVALPANLNTLLHRPWTLLTHMFTHIDVWHAVGNMIWLWFFGFILQDLTGNQKIIPVYIYSALGGALVFLLAYNFLPVLRPGVGIATAIGASAGVMGIAAAATVIAPTYKVFPILNGGIPLWIVTALYLIIDLAGIAGSGMGAHLAHLGGALTGYFFVLSFRRGYDWGGWMNRFFTWVNELFNPDRPRKTASPRDQLYYQARRAPYKKTPNITEQRIDEILDKINQRGYHSLSSEEVELLKRASGKGS